MFSLKNLARKGLILSSLRFVPDGPIDNKSELVQALSWMGKGDKPLLGLQVLLAKCYQFVT